MKKILIGLFLITSQFQFSQANDGWAPLQQDFQSFFADHRAQLATGKNKCFINQDEPNQKFVLHCGENSSDLFIGRDLLMISADDAPKLTGKFKKFSNGVITYTFTLPLKENQLPEQMIQLSASFDSKTGELRSLSTDVRTFKGGKSDMCYCDKSSEK